jgi:hypothetical protein
MTSSKISFLIPTVVLVLAAGCSSDPKKQIVGKWEATEDSDVRVLEFDGAGGMKAYLKGDEEPVSGTYELADGKTLTANIRKPIEDRLQERVKRSGTSSVSMPFWVAAGRAEVAFNGSEMTVKHNDKTLTYKRAK